MMAVESVPLPPPPTSTVLSEVAANVRLVAPVVLPLEIDLKAGRGQIAVRVDRRHIEQQIGARDAQLLVVGDVVDSKGGVPASADRSPTGFD